MRLYEDKKNLQKKAYHTDRFTISPSLKKEDIKSDEVFLKDIESLKKSIEIKDTYIEAGQLVIWVESKDNFKTLKKLKTMGYEILSELSAVDFLDKKGGFEIFYQLLSMQRRKRARVKCFITQDESIKSVESIYKSANWAEREMYDMFGVKIAGHPYMKRILMPDDWQGYPLLKTYPLEGDEAAQWYEIDTLFGKEYREVVGEEQRDPARVDVKDTISFAHIRKEVPKGAPYSNEPTLQEYQESDGVKLVKKVKKDDSKTLKERR